MGIECQSPLFILKQEGNADSVLNTMQTLPFDSHTVAYQC